MNYITPHLFFCLSHDIFLAASCYSKVVKQELIFVYNANSPIFSQLGDLIHKTISPKTYNCNLCGLTYSGISQKNEWKTFVSTLPFKAKFLHKDEFKKDYLKYAITFYPAVFKKEDDKLSEIITASEINQQKTLTELQELVRRKISSL